MGAQTLPEHQKRIVIERKDASLVSGYVEQIDTDILLVRTLQGIDTVGRNSIQRATIIRDLDVEPIGMNGFATGCWLILFSLGTGLHPDTPMPYPGIHFNFGTTIVTLVLSSASTLLGSLFDYHQRDDRVTFDFSDPSSNAKLYAKLREALAETPFRSRFRLLINSAYQIPMVRSRLRPRMDDAGYDEIEIADQREINMLRSLQATYAVKPNFDVGLLFSVFGEQLPIHHDSLDLSYLDSGAIHQREEVSSTGYYVTGAYRLPIDSTEAIDITLGAGLGMAKIQYKLSGLYGLPSIDSLYNSVNKILPSGIVFARLNIYTNEALTVGISADYIITGTLELPANEKLHLASERISFGNASVGVSLGWRF
ncbi:MAG TPA: hypothetical protein VJ508_00460 [Saprospiraceae bacterium]|nr:hypothetical protein [Saprospiraceae bacterium]